MNQTVHRLAGAGNAAVLILLVLLLGNGRVLPNGYSAPVALDNGAAPPTATSPPTGPHARRAILVVIDGLRTDVAADPDIMPFLRSLAQRGGQGTAHVESLVPSTIAGIMTLATGQVPAPASFVFDFGSPAASKGGIFQSVIDANGPCFVAGPQLWLDLYAQWIRSSHATSGLAGDDAATLAAGLQAIRDQANQLIVLHFSETDTMAHLHGSASQQYRQAAQWCDDALRQISQLMDADTCILVTSDHGVTETGSHAGPEPEVLSTPLIVFGPGLPTGPLKALRQRDVPQILLRALGMDLHPDSRAPSIANEEPKGHRFLLVGLVAASLFSAARLGSRLQSTTPVFHRYVALLNLAIWATLAMAWTLGPQSALVLCAAVMCITASATISPPRLFGWIGNALTPRQNAASSQLPPSMVPRPNTSHNPMVLMAVVLLLGTTMGGLRLLDALFCVQGTASTRIASASYAGTLLVALINFSLGRLIGRWLSGAPCPPTPHRTYVTAIPTPDAPQGFSAGLAAGVLLVLISTLAGRLLGQTFSLSSIETHTAFHVAEGSLGIPGAVAAILLRESLPALSVLLGMTPTLTTLGPARAGGLAAGLGGMIVAQAVIPTLILGCAAPDQQTLASLGLGGLVRTLTEAIYCFIPATLLSLRRSRKLSSVECLQQ